MIILFILGILLGAVAVMFSLQNIEMVEVVFFSWQLEGSLATILLLAITTGIIATLLILLPGSIKNSWYVRKLKGENARLEEDLRKQKELHHFASRPAASAEDLRKIEDGATL